MAAVPVLNCSASVWWMFNAFWIGFFPPDAGSSARFTAMPNQLMSSLLWLQETEAARHLFSRRVRQKLKTSSASRLLGFLDPEKKLFSHRILSRDECIDPFSKTGNLRWVFWNMENISVVNHCWHYHLGTFYLSTRAKSKLFWPSLHCVLKFRGCNL